MKSLIEIQKVINVIEDATLDKRYHSKFNYKDWATLEVETFSSQQTMIYKMIFDRFIGACAYIIANDKIEFLDMEDKIEPNTYTYKIKLPKIEEIVRKSNELIKEVGK